ncbi:unnamed protein product [Mytilus edulis]|uniref:Uncharacterized protein n=1 Tax=Mytilus edulis TaxID=6550 RepID=A0A8S3T4I8_MYTED|nr:unnamed protein product [Mytilus edulis]
MGSKKGKGKVQKKVPNEKKRKRSSSKTPPQSKTTKMDANVNKVQSVNRNTPYTPYTPVADHLSTSHNILYGNPSNLNHLNTYGQTSIGTPYQSYPMAPPTTPADFLIANQPLQTHLSFSSPQSQPTEFSMYSKFENFMIDCSQKLQKLDILDEIVVKMNAMEQRFEHLDRNVTDMRQQINNHNTSIQESSIRSSVIEQNVDFIKRENDKLQNENYELRDRIVDIQTRSMRDNLIFRGIPDVSDTKQPENTEEKLQTFLTNELGIENNIPFHVVHRLKPRRDRGPRGIVAKFEKRKDREMVMAAAREKFKERDTQFRVHEQFPAEVIQRRRELVPIMKDARQKGHVAHLRDDKLFIDNKRFFPHPPPQMPHRPPFQNQRPMEQRPPPPFPGA